MAPSGRAPPPLLVVVVVAVALTAAAGAARAQVACKVSHGGAERTGSCLSQASRQPCWGVTAQASECIGEDALCCVPGTAWPCRVGINGQDVAGECIETENVGGDDIGCHDFSVRTSDDCPAADPGRKIGAVRCCLAPSCAVRYLGMSGALVRLPDWATQFMYARLLKLLDEAAAKGATVLDGTDEDRPDAGARSPLGGVYRPAGGAALSSFAAMLAVPSESVEVFRRLFTAAGMVFEVTAEDLASALGKAGRELVGRFEERRRELGGGDGGDGDGGGGGGDDGTSPVPLIEAAPATAPKRQGQGQPLSPTLEPRFTEPFFRPSKWLNTRWSWCEVGKLGDQFYNDFWPLGCVEAYLRSLAEKHSSVVKLRELGPTFDGNTVLALDVDATPAPPPGDSPAPQPAPPRPRALVLGTEHPREWMSLMGVVFSLQQLLESADAHLARLRSEVRWTFVPLLNPDGYDFTWPVIRGVGTSLRRSRSGAQCDRLWRKNTFFRPEYGQCRGVNINRNYPLTHASAGVLTGPSGVCTERYGGDGPASEVETKLVLAEFSPAAPELFVDVHTAEQTVLVPPSQGYLQVKGRRRQSKDPDLLKTGFRVAAAMNRRSAQVAGADSRTFSVTDLSVAGVTPGTSADTAFDMGSRLVYGLELRNGAGVPPLTDSPALENFIPGPEKIRVTAAEALAGLAELGRELLAYNVHFKNDRPFFGEKPGKLQALDGTAALERLVADLKARPDARVFVVGHSSSPGALSYNVDLSKRRAAYVRQALADQGVDVTARLAAFPSHHTDADGCTDVETGVRACGEKHTNRSKLQDDASRRVEVELF